MGYFNPNGENVSEWKNNLQCVLTAHCGGLHWAFTNSKKDKLSIVLNSCSYGGGNGLFEVMPSWVGDVEGHLTFGGVQKWIDKLAKRGN